MAIEVPYRYKDNWDREQARILRYISEVDPKTRQVRWGAAPRQAERRPPEAVERPVCVVALGGGTGLPVVLRG